MKSALALIAILGFASFVEALPGPWFPLPMSMANILAYHAAQYYGKILTFPLMAFGSGWNGLRFTRFRVIFWAVPSTGVPCHVYLNWPASTPVVTKTTLSFSVWGNSYCPP